MKRKIIYLKNCMHLYVEAMVIYKLILKFDVQLDLVNIFYTSSFSKNLIFVFRLTCIRFEFNFYGSVVDLLKNKKIISFEILVDNC